MTRRRGRKARQGSVGHDEGSGLYPKGNGKSLKRFNKVCVCTRTRVCRRNTQVDRHDQICILKILRGLLGGKQRKGIEAGVEAGGQFRGRRSSEVRVRHYGSSGGTQR